MRSLVPWRRERRHAAPARWDEWFDRVWENPFTDLLPSSRGAFSTRMPSVDVSEDKKEITVRAEVPGMSEKDIDLSWHEGVLRMRGEKNVEKEENKKGRRYRECSYGYFSRDIPVGRNIDWTKAKAKYRNGVLTVTLPKTESARQAIEIKVQ
jgi:HSP20 family protein